MIFKFFPLFLVLLFINVQNTTSDTTSGSTQPGKTSPSKATTAEKPKSTPTENAKATHDEKPKSSPTDAEKPKSSPTDAEKPHHDKKPKSTPTEAAKSTSTISTNSNSTKPSEESTPKTVTEPNKNVTLNVTYEDVTTFRDSLNRWDFRGEWSKYNLTHMRNRAIVPDLKSSEDHIVLVNKVDRFTSLLRKRFPALINVTLSIVEFLNFTGDIFIVGMVVNPVKNYQKIFLNKTKNDWKNKNLYWVMEAFNLGDHHTPFEIIFKATSSSPAIWGLDSITVKGIGTSAKTNHSGIPPAVVPPSWYGKDEDPLPPSSQYTAEDKYNTKAELSSIATAIWKGFYVLLGLFVAVLIILIIMAVLQRRKGSHSVESSVAAYNPRPSYYPPKPNENPAYQTDPV